MPSTLAMEARPNSEQALMQLYSEMRGDVARFARSRLSASDADDVVAEVFCAAVRKLQTDECPSVTAGWLMVVTRHKVIDTWRRTERLRRLESELAGQTVRLHAPDVADLVCERCPIDGLAQLSHDHQQVLRLKYLEHRPVRDIALILGVGEVAVASRLARARRALVDVFGREHSSV